MRRIRVSGCAFALLLATLLGACSFSGEVDYARDVTVTSPRLVVVSPGVQVVEDANAPLFYVNGFYWLYRDAAWLRSDSYRGGFARVDYATVPHELRAIEQPQLYAHYRENATRYREAYARDRRMQTRSPEPYGPVSIPPEPANPPPQPIPSPATPQPPTAPQPIAPPQPSTLQPTQEPINNSSPEPPVDHSTPPG